VQKRSNKVVCQITDKNLTNNALRVPMSVIVGEEVHVTATLARTTGLDPAKNFSGRIFRSRYVRKSAAVFVE